MGRSKTPKSGRGRFTATVEFDRDGKVIRVRPTEDNVLFRAFLLAAMGKDGRAMIDFECGTPPQLPILPPPPPEPVPPGPLPDMCACEIRLSKESLERFAAKTK
jgi:hypothetical protein